MSNEFLINSKTSYAAITEKSPILIIDAKTLSDNGVSWQEYLSFVKPKGLVVRQYGKLNQSQLGLPAGSATLVDLVSGYVASTAILHWCLSCGIKEMPYSVDLYQLMLLDIEQPVISAIYMSTGDKIVERFIMHIEQGHENKEFMSKLYNNAQSFDIDLGVL